MANSYSTLRKLSMIGGMGLVSVVGYLNAYEAAHITGSWTSPTVIAIIALAAGSALAVPVAQEFAAKRQWVLMTLTIIGIIAGESFGFFTSAERLLATRNERVAAIVRDNGQAKIAADELKAANDELKTAKEKENEERSKGGCKSICKDWIKKAEDAGKRVAAAELKVKAAPAVKSESLIADVTGWSATVVEIVPALAFPTALLVLGFVLLAFSHNPEHEHKPATKAKAKAPATAANEEPAAKPVTRKQGKNAKKAEVYNWVREFRERNGRDPMIPEVRKAHGLKKTTAWRSIQEAKQA